MAKKNYVGGPPNRDEIKALRTKRALDALNAVREIHHLSEVSHEGDIPDEKERREQSNIETLSAVIYMVSDYDYYEATSAKVPGQPQKKVSPREGRELPDTLGSPDEDVFNPN